MAYLHREISHYLFVKFLLIYQIDVDNKRHQYDCHHAQYRKRNNRLTLALCETGEPTLSVVLVMVMMTVIMVLMMTVTIHYDLLFF